MTRAPAQAGASDLDGVTISWQAGRMMGLVDQHPRHPRVSGRGFTLIELLVVVSILGILASIATVHYLNFQTRAKVAVSKTQMRTLGNAIEVYFTDHQKYPVPLAARPGDPLGVVASTALVRLTTPVAYVSADAFRDPFGLLSIQSVSSSQTSDDPFRPPTPGFNREQSLLYYYYPNVALLTGNARLARKAYGIVSIGPDRLDSFIAFYPYPEALPDNAGLYGIGSVSDTVYDPTNGTISGGDLALFGGSSPVTGLIGG